MNLEDDILIIAYLNKDLNKQDLIKFEKRLEKDISFRENLLLEKQLQETLNEKDWCFIKNTTSEEVETYTAIFKSEEANALKEKLKNIQSNYQRKPKKKPLFNKILYIGIAAAVVLFFIVYNLIDNEFDTNKLVIASLKDTNLPSLVTRGSENKGLEKIELAFNAKSYNKVLILINKEKNKTNSALYLYKGVSLLKLNKPSEAIKIFNELIQSDLLDAQKGKWFKALALLKKNKVKASKSLLEEIIAQKEYNFQKATTLLNQLD